LVVNNTEKEERERETREGSIFKRRSLETFSIS
jgi:hypothetical protein